MFFETPVSVSQHRHLCAGANQPPFAHRSRCSLSAQAPSLPSSDGPIMPVVDQLSCCVCFVNSRRSGPRRRRNGNPPRPHTSIHTHETVRLDPSPSKHVEMRSFLLERCSAASSREKMPPLLPSFSPPLPYYLASPQAPRFHHCGKLFLSHSLPFNSCSSSTLLLILLPFHSQWRSRTELRTSSSGLV